MQPARGLVAPPRYLSANELDEKPQILTRPEPEFPPDAKASTGRVVLRLYISESGGMDEIGVVSVEPERVFEEPAVRAFAAALFTPGRKQGVPVRSTVTIEVLFGATLPIGPTAVPEGPLFQPPRGRPPAVTPRR
ncbi:MAG: TonB family protein [Candidatus Parcubacteria bacterium]|nr:TonB family protein [Burkholderiales bacterium]